MSDSTLPHRVNIRKAVTRSARYAGCLGVEQLPLFSSQLNAAGAPVKVAVEFGEDEESQQWVAVSIEAPVVLECQRCLGPVHQVLRGESRLGLVQTDEQAAALCEAYEPLIAIDEVDLWEVASEELALALPVVAYHPEGECAAPGAGNNDDVTDAAQGSDSPFSKLASLLDSSAGEEKQ